MLYREQIMMDGLEKELQNINKNINKFQNKLIGLNLDDLKKLDGIENVKDLYSKGVAFKKIFGKINDLIHAYGIISNLSKVLDQDEKIISTSLGADTSTSKFDLITTKKICEFKFQIWDEKGNAYRKKQLLKDYIKLILAGDNKDHESKKRIIFMLTENEVAKVKKFLEGTSKISSNLKNSLLNDFFDFKKRNSIENIERVDELYKEYKNVILIKSLD